jgi:hypothetical protein
MPKQESYHKLNERDKEIVHAALGYAPGTRDSRKFSVKEVESAGEFVNGKMVPIMVRYHVYYYEHDHEYIGYSIVEDHMTHFRRRGDSRYDEWKTISK